MYGSSNAHPLSHAPARGLFPFLFLFLFLFLPVSRGLSLAVSLTLSRALALRVYGHLCVRGGSAQLGLRGRGQASLGQWARLDQQGPSHKGWATAIGL